MFCSVNTNVKDKLTRIANVDKGIERAMGKSSGCKFKKNHNVSHPPESKVVSSFLATMLGIPCDNHVFRTTSQRA